MGKYRSAALSEILRRREKAKRDAENAYDAAISSDPLLCEIESKISENSRRLLSLYGQSAENTSAIEENIANLRDELYSRMVKLNIDTDAFTPKYTCKKCEDKGFYRGKPCECLLDAEKGLAYEKLNSEIPLEKTGFDNFRLDYYPEECRSDMADNLDFCKSYAASFNKKSGSILMTGNTGLGKTHLSLAIAKEVIGKGFSVVYGSAQNFLSKIETEHFSRTEERGDTLSGLLECDLLLFDDLGTEFINPFIKSTIYSVINTRLLSSKPTIINTNFSLEELKAHYGDRILSRIMGNYDILIFSGKDIRVIKKMQEF